MMSKALSLDLRIRVLSAVAEGLSHRAAAARFRCECGEREPVARTDARAG